MRETGIKPIVIEEICDIARTCCRNILDRRIENMRETGIKPIVIEEICDIARKYNVQKVI